MTHRASIQGWLALSLGIVTGGLVSECAGQDVGSEAWFKNTWAEASKWKPSAPMHFRVSFEYRNYVDEAELSSLQAQRARTESGEQRLQHLEWQAAHPLMQWTADVCTDGDRLRYGSSEGEAGLGGVHFALGKDTDWSLSKGFLRIAPPDMAKPEYGVRNWFATADGIVRTTVWAGFGDATPGGLQPAFSRLEGNEWAGEVSVGGAGPAVSLIRGRLAPESMPSIAGMTIQSGMLADEKLRALSPLGTVEYVTWSTNDVLGRPVVSLSRWSDGKGRTTQTMKLETIEIYSPQQLDDLMRMPSDGVTDAWGYKMVVHEVQDVRPGHLSQTKVENGVSTPVPLSIPLREERESPR